TELWFTIRMNLSGLEGEAPAEPEDRLGRSLALQTRQTNRTPYQETFLHCEGEGSAGASPSRPDRPTGPRIRRPSFIVKGKCPICNCRLWLWVRSGYASERKRFSPLAANSGFVENSHSGARTEMGKASRGPQERGVGKRNKHHGIYGLLRFRM